MLRFSSLLLPSASLLSFILAFELMSFSFFRFSFWNLKLLLPSNSLSLLLASFLELVLEWRSSSSLSLLLDLVFGLWTDLVSLSTFFFYLLLWNWLFVFLTYFLVSYCWIIPVHGKLTPFFSIPSLLFRCCFDWIFLLYIFFRDISLIERYKVLVFRDVHCINVSLIFLFTICAVSCVVFWRLS